MLADLQDLLKSIYALEMSHDINDFLVTDREVAEELDAGGRDIEEKLLIAENGDEAEVSLYLARELVARLRRRDPRARLDGENLADFWTVCEGVSHFIYYAWNAAADRPVTLLEMELQAEVDKFVATAALLDRQGERLPRGLHHWLFEMPRFDGRLSGAELERYRRANRYAGKFCRALAARLAAGTRGEDLVRELRHFYRLTQPAKIEYIEGRTAAV
ncbi:MAG TPA: hypothetical protein VF322_05540 [Gammaproteobacteria bacterium]